MQQVDNRTGQGRAMGTGISVEHGNTGLSGQEGRVGRRYTDPDLSLTMKNSGIIIGQTAAFIDFNASTILSFALPPRGLAADH